MGKTTEITVARQEGAPEVTVVRIEGTLDEAAGRALAQRVSPLVHRARPMIVLDLSALASLRDDGVTPIMDMAYLAQDNHGQVVLAGASPEALGLLRSMGLDDVLLMREDVASAVAGLRGEPVPAAAGRRDTEEAAPSVAAVADHASGPAAPAAAAPAAGSAALRADVRRLAELLSAHLEDHAQRSSGARAMLDELSAIARRLEE